MNVIYYNMTTRYTRFQILQRRYEYDISASEVQLEPMIEISAEEKFGRWGLVYIMNYNLRISRVLFILWSIFTGSD